MTIPAFDSAAQLAAAVGSGQVSALAVTEAALAAIDDVDESLGAFLTVDDDGARQAAAQIDEQVAAGQQPGPLAGVPVAVKDNLSTKGLTTTGAAKILADYVPPYDATAVARLRQAGAVIVGKTNLDEMAMGSSTETSAFKITRNPWDLNRVPGGSSGGSAVAVAARLVPLALGSDTGGSIRQPAAMTGIVGLRPTYGRISRYGLLPMAGSFDVVGPMAANVADCALGLQVMAGFDPADASSAQTETDDWLAATAAEATPDLSGMRIGLPQEFFSDAVDPAVKDLVLAAAQQLGALGAQTEQCSLPSLNHSLATYYLLISGEIASAMARYDGVRYGRRVGEEGGLDAMYAATRGEGFGAEVKRRILFGTYLLGGGRFASHYEHAQRMRRRITDEMNQALEQFDLLLAPVTPTPAFPLGAKLGDNRDMYRSDILTLAASLAGLPALSLPCGFSDGLPVGMQLLGRAFDEGTLLQVGSAYQQVTDFHRRQPVQPAAGGGQK